MTMSEFTSLLYAVAATLSAIVKLFRLTKKRRQ